ncbi:MAG: phosphotransferase [Bauldia sp.]
MADEPEIALSGGRMTSGVVRVGETVRRPQTPNSDFVRRLLRHLAANGFDGAPAYLGSDERGRDVLSFIDGEVPGDLGFHDDETLRRAAMLIRRFHDLGRGLVDATDAEIVCHNDLSPCNFVFRGGAPVAIIDFDAAAPGTRVHDLGYAAWLWLDIGSPEISAPEQRRRLAVFLDSYGTREPDAVLTAILERQQMLAAEGRRTGNAGLAQWAAGCRRWTCANFDVLRVS